MDDIISRVAKMEQRLDGLCRELNEEREESRRRSDKIFDALEALQKNANSNKGFFGGVVFSVSAIFAFLAFIFSRSH